MNSPANAVLAFDQGGHATRAFVVNAEGEILFRCYSDVDTRFAGDDIAEHDSAEMLNSLVECCRQTEAFLEQAEVKVLAAGLATQRSSIVCWDRHNGQPLTPVISWQDRRNRLWMDTFADRDQDIHRITGLYSTAHYGVSKLKWCQQHLPAVEQAREQRRLAWGPLASFLLFHLLDEQPLLVDPVNASRTLLWSLREKDWSPELLQLFDMDKRDLPRCVDNEYPFGYLHLAGQRIPFRVLTGDQPAALFAGGSPDLDTISVNIGTGAFIQRLYEGDVDYAPRLLMSVVHKDSTDTLYALEGTVNGAGSAFVVVEEQMGMNPRVAQKGLPGWMDQATADPTFDLLYLNGVSGLGSPWWQADFGSRFVGTGSPEQKLVAVAESIVFMIAANLGEMQRFPGAAERISVTGGLSAVDPLCRRLADLSCLTVSRPDQEEATALGLAWLLLPDKGRWPATRQRDAFAPRPDEALQRRYQEWCRRMPAIRSNS